MTISKTRIVLLAKVVNKVQFRVELSVALALTRVLCVVLLLDVVVDDFRSLLLVLPGLLGQVVFD